MKKDDRVLKDLFVRFAESDVDPGGAEVPDIIVEASHRIAAIYADLLVGGMSEEQVARAMLGATITLYDSLGLAAALPFILRLAADRVQDGNARSH